MPLDQQTRILVHRGTHRPAYNRTAPHSQLVFDRAQQQFDHSWIFASIEKTEKTHIVAKLFQVLPVQYSRPSRQYSSGPGDQKSLRRYPGSLSIENLIVIFAHQRPAWGIGFIDR